MPYYLTNFMISNFLFHFHCRFLEFSSQQSKVNFNDYLDYMAVILQQFHH